MIKQRFNTPDVIAGGAIITLGFFTGVVSLNYPIGSIASIGPGVFPLALSLILVGLGAGIILTSTASDEAATITLNWRATAAIGAAFLAFAFLITSIGLVPAVVISTAIARLSEPDFRITRVLMLGGGLALLCWLIFIVGLSIPTPAARWPF